MTGSLVNAFQYAAREYDGETGVYLYRTRYLDTNVGRFLSEDRARFNAGVNFYSYVKNEPTDFIDPFGLKCTQATPWQEIPNMGSPDSLKPYATFEDGLYWQLDTWNPANGWEGSTPNSCVCQWTATRMRVRKLYRENVTEEAWFNCSDCVFVSHLERRTRTKTKQWETDGPGNPIWTPETRWTTGPMVSEGDGPGVDRCLCQPPPQ